MKEEIAKVEHAKELVKAELEAAQSKKRDSDALEESSSLEQTEAGGEKRQVKRHKSKGSKKDKKQR